MKTKKIILILVGLIISLLFAGCTKFLNGSYYSKVDPDFKISKKSLIIVTTDKKDIDSKYYVSFVVSELKNNGFTNTYSYKNMNKPKVNNILFISVEEQYDSYSYSGADYGSVDSATTTKNKIFGVTGYSQKTGYINDHYFKINWYDLKSKQRIFYLMTSTHKKNCDNDKLYKFLIKEAISRVDFSKPKNYKFEVKMPENFTCE